MPPAIPLALDLAGRRGVPAGTTGQAFVAIPSGPGGPACHDTAPPPADILAASRAACCPAAPHRTCSPGLAHPMSASGRPELLHHQLLHHRRMVRPAGAFRGRRISSSSSSIGSDVSIISFQSSL